MQTLTRQQFDAAIKPLRPALICHATRLLLTHADVEDAVQDCLSRAYT